MLSIASSSATIRSLAVTMSVCRHLSKQLGAPLSIARCGSPRLIGEKVANFILAATVTRKMLDAENVQNGW